MPVNRVSFFLKHQWNKTTKQALLTVSVGLSTIVLLSGLFLSFGLTPLDLQSVNTIAQRMTFWGTISIFAVGGGWTLLNTFFIQRMRQVPTDDFCEKEKYRNYVEERARALGIFDAMEGVAEWHWSFAINPKDGEYDLMHAFIMHRDGENYICAYPKEHLRNKQKTKLLQNNHTTGDGKVLLEKRGEVLISQLSAENRKLIQESGERLTAGEHDLVKMIEGEGIYMALIEKEEPYKHKVRVFFLEKQGEALISQLSANNRKLIQESRKKLTAEESDLLKIVEKGKTYTALVEKKEPKVRLFSNPKKIDDALPEDSHYVQGTLARIAQANIEYPPHGHRQGITLESENHMIYVLLWNTVQYGEGSSCVSYGRKHFYTSRAYYKYLNDNPNIQNLKEYQPISH